MTQETSGRERPDPDPVRAEAERLVATGLAAMSMAADRIGAPTRERGGAAAASFDALGDMLFGPAGRRRHSVANDSPECCSCPVCRVIAAARQPSPTFAEKLATGVGFMAEGAARVLRGVAGATGAASATRPAPGPPPPPEPDPWAAATAEPPAPAMTVPPPAAPAKQTATKAVAKNADAKQAVVKKSAARKTVKKAAARPKKTTGNAGP